MARGGGARSRARGNRLTIGGTASYELCPASVKGTALLRSPADTIIRLVSTPTFFLSDVHLRPTDGEQSDLARDLHALLRFVAESGGDLFILGDLFDFWFEYRYGIVRQYLPTLRVLGEIVQAGVPVTFLPGNHDNWAGPALEDWGLRVVRGPLRTTVGGRQVVLAHGDGLGVREPWTRLFRGLVRHPATIAAYRMLGPDIGVPLALGISGVSRRFSGHREIDAHRVRDRVIPALDVHPPALVVLGHYHQPTVLRADDGVEFALIADFLHRRSYARLDAGAFRLCRWTAPERLQVEQQGEAVRRAESR